MSDYNSSLPVRSQADADERVQSKIVDFTTPAQGLTVDSGGRAQVKVHGNDPAATDRTLLLSEGGHTSVNGAYNASTNTDPSNIGLVSLSRNASPADSQQTLRVTGATSADTTKRTVDVSIQDSSGETINAANPLAVFQVSNPPGTEVHDYKTASAVAANATDNHNYSVANGVVFSLKQILASGSGKIKVELMIGDGAVSEAFTSKIVEFNSTANPNVRIPLSVPIIVTGTANTTTIRVAITNKDNQPQDLYSTVIGNTV